MTDFNWMSAGGFTIDPSGDIAVAPDLTEITQMVISRLKATTDGWQLYPIGANLNSIIGQTDPATAEAAIVRQITQALTYQFLPAGTFQIQALIAGNTAQIFVFLNQTLLVTATASSDGSVTVAAA